MEGNHDDAIGQGAPNRVDCFEPQADEVMKVNDVRLQVAKDSKEVPFKLLGAAVRNQEVVILIGMVEDVAAFLPQAHKSCPAMPHDGIADTRKEAGFRTADLVEPLVEVVGRDFGTPKGVA